MVLMIQIKMVTDQARSQDGSILAKFFFACLWTVTKWKSMLTEQAWPLKDLQKELFLAGLTGQDWRILPARVANQRTGFASSCPLAGSPI